VVTASLAPSPPVQGEMATALVKVRNRGDRPVDDLVVVDELSANAGVRSASSAAGSCSVGGRRAECRFDRVAPGETVVIEVRLLLDPASTSRTVVQRITAGGNGHAQAADRSVTQLVAAGPPGPSTLLALPGPTVTLVAFVGFVLASSHGGARRLSARR
jgi:hypothetical protein